MSWTYLGPLLDAQSLGKVEYVLGGGHPCEAHIRSEREESAVEDNADCTMDASIVGATLRTLVYHWGQRRSSSSSSSSRRRRRHSSLPYLTHSGRRGAWFSSSCWTNSSINTHTKMRTVSLSIHIHTETQQSTHQSKLERESVCVCVYACLIPSAPGFLSPGQQLCA